MCFYRMVGDSVPYACTVVLKMRRVRVVKSPDCQGEHPGTYNFPRSRFIVPIYMYRRAYNIRREPRREEYIYFVFGGIKQKASIQIYFALRVHIFIEARWTYTTVHNIQPVWLMIRVFVITARHQSDGSSVDYLLFFLVFSGECLSETNYVLLLIQP
jgi:hypothetical protein